MAVHILKIILCFCFISEAFLNVLPRLSFETRTLPKYKINLDLPVRQRYKDILLEYKDKVKVLVYASQNSYLSKLVAKLGKSLINKKTQDPEWYEYVEAVSEICEISLSEAVLISITYELACTSAIINDENNNIFMGRNLDFNFWYVNAHLMIDVEYFKNNELFYKGIELVGFRGAINAVKIGKFATSINLRWGSTSKIGDLIRIYLGYPTPDFALMKVMLEAESYKEAFDLMKSIKLSASAFLNVAGVNKNEGAIISREPTNVYRIDQLDVDNSKWFIVICNTDMDKKETEDDFRKIPTEDRINKIGKSKINFNNLFTNVMSLYPTNNIETIYTTIQSAQNNGFFNTTLWLP